MSACRTYGALSAAAPFGPNWMSRCSYEYPAIRLDHEVGVLREVGDLELCLRLHHLAFAGLHGLEAGVRVSDVAEHDPIELHRRDRVLRVLDDRDLHALLPALELPRPAGDGDRVLEQPCSCPGCRTVLAWRRRCCLRSVCQSANTFLKTTVPFLPAQLTDLMSSIPVRVAGLLAGLIQTCHVAFQSAHVTGVPSLQFAFGLNCEAGRQRALLEELRRACEQARDPVARCCRESARPARCC